VLSIENVVARIYDPAGLIHQRVGIATVATVAWTRQVLRRILPMSAVDGSTPAPVCRWWSGR
jgi:hypothetical protein